MLYTITVLDFLTSTVKVFKNVTLDNQMDAEEWLYENTDVILDNCQWMATESDSYFIEVIDHSPEGAEMDKKLFVSDL